MRIVVLVTAALLAGCVQQPYAPPGPIQLQPYGPAIPYRIAPAPYRGLDGPPVLAPVPDLPRPDLPRADLPRPDLPRPDAPAQPGADDTGAIPLQDMPTPAAESPAAPASPAKPQDAPPTAVVQRPPTSGPGSNVPLEGFRPMHSQTRPTP